MNASGGDHEAARRALLEAADRTQRLFAALPDADRALPRSEWTVGEAGAHLLVGLRGFTDGVRGQEGRWAAAAPESATWRERLVGWNATTIGEEPARDCAAVGRLVVEGTREFLAVSAGRGPDERVATPWYGHGASLSMKAATCLLLAEQVVHGYDIARAVGAPWPISHRDACLVFVAVMSMLPMIVDPAAVRGVTASFDVRLRRGHRFAVHVRDGTVRVEPGGAGMVDCHLSADPVAFLLVGYGRTSQWRAIGRGELLAWGRRPWLALRMKGLFFDP